MKRIFFIVTICFFSNSLLAQNKINDASVENNFVVNVINPGLDYELAVGKKFVISVGVGIGYHGAYSNITVIPNNGFNYVITPFVDIQYKFIYNRVKRARNDKPIAYNSGNFVSFRITGRGRSIAENITRTDDTDFAIGPTWGLQRSFKKMRILADIGPQYYFDTLGNSGFFPFMLQINLGFNLSD